MEEKDALGAKLVGIQNQMAALDVSIFGLAEFHSMAANGFVTQLSQDPTHTVTLLPSERTASLKCIHKSLLSLGVVFL
jgi:hypothetical protein